MPLLAGMLSNQPVRSVPLLRFPLGRSREILHNVLNGRGNVLSTSDAQMLISCWRYLPLGDHAQRLAGEGVDVSYVLERLRALAADGLMISRAELLNKCLDTQEDYCGVQPEISWVAIPTRDRPDELIRSADGYVKNARELGRNCGLFVADGSESEANQQKNRRGLIGLMRKYGCSVVYAGHEEKVAYIAQVCRSGCIPRSAVEFALFGPAHASVRVGANRNAILLGTLGSMVLTVDDDTEARVATVPGFETRGRLTFSGEGEDSQVWVFPSFQKANEFVHEQEVDILAESARFLGKTTCEAVATALRDSTVDLDHACAHAIMALYTGVGRIRITGCGTVGDPGVDSNSGLVLSTNPYTRGRLIASESAYHQFLSSRAVVRLFPSAAIGHIKILLTTACGLDNRELLPPFLPICRGEDGVFGTTLNSCFESSFVCNLPWTIRHVPAGNRHYVWQPLAAVRSCDVISTCLTAGSPFDTPHSAIGRLNTLGRHLISLGEVSANEFYQTLRYFLWKRAGQIVAHCEALLEQEGHSPSYWARDVEREIEQTERLCGEPTYGVPSDIGPDAERRMQELVKGFGELLVWWPAIVERCRELEYGGVRMGVSLTGTA